MKCSNLNWIRDKKIPYHVTQKENVTHLRFFPFHLAGKPRCTELMKYHAETSKRLETHHKSTRDFSATEKKKIFWRKHSCCNGIKTRCILLSASQCLLNADFSYNLFLWNTFLKFYEMLLQKRGTSKKATKLLSFCSDIYLIVHTYIKSSSLNKLVGSIAKKKC